MSCQISGQRSEMRAIYPAGEDAKNQVSTSTPAAEDSDHTGPGTLLAVLLMLAWLKLRPLAANTCFSITRLNGKYVLGVRVTQACCTLTDHHSEQTREVYQVRSSARVRDRWVAQNDSTRKPCDWRGFYYGVIYDQAQCNSSHSYPGTV